METDRLEDKSLIRVLESYYESNYGGAENWALVQSLRFDGRLHLPGGSIRFSAYKKKPDYCKIMLYPSPQRQITLAYDGKDAWQLDTGGGVVGPTDMPGKDALNFIRDASTGSHLIHPQMPGKSITLGSVIEVEGAMCRQVHVTLPSDQTVTYVLNLGNHAQRQQITTNAVNGAREVTTHYEYEKVQGIRIPTESILRVDGEQIHRIEITDITLNTGLTPWMFERPPETAPAREATEPVQLDTAFEIKPWNSSPFEGESSEGSVFD